MSFPDTISVSRTSIYSSRLAEQFLSIKEQGELVDCKICVGGQTIECHRLILAVNSPVLRRMINSNIKEKRNQEIILESNIQPHIMKEILTYMYTKECTIKTADLKDTLIACDFLEFLELKKACLEQMPSLFTPSNVLGWLTIAEQLHLDGIKTICKQMISFHSMMSLKVKNS